MYPIGLTGGIGSGKTTVRKIFQTLAIETICADEIAHQILNEPLIISEIQIKFGTSIIIDDCAIDRRKLRSLIFNDNENKKWLENLIHPIIRKKIISLLENSKSKYTVIEIPLLSKKTIHFYPYLREIISIISDKSSRIRRVKIRDDVSEKSITRVMDQQITDYERNKISTYVINNNESIKNLKDKIIQLHLNLLSKIDNAEKFN